MPWLVLLYTLMHITLANLAEIFSMFITMFTTELLCRTYIFVFLSYLQGCGGTLNGTIPSSGTLQWTIIAADLKNVLVIFSDWTVSINTHNQHNVFMYSIFNFSFLLKQFQYLMVCKLHRKIFSQKSPMNYFSVVPVLLASCKSGQVQMQMVSFWLPIIQAILHL